MTEKAAPAFIGDRPRFKTITLQWPVAYDGKEYRAISIVRMTAGDVAKYQEDLAALLNANPDATTRFPLFRDEAGECVPDAVLDALDDDDKFEIDKAVLDFFPRRFRGDEKAASESASGEAIEPSSQA
jgi:hypothetical protein